MAKNLLTLAEAIEKGHVDEFVAQAQTVDSYALSEEERADLEVALEEVKSGELATDAEVGAVFAPHRG